MKNYMKRNKEVVVIGISRFAMELINKLNQISGYSIVAIDISQEKLERLQGIKNIIVGDATNEEFMTGIGIDNADYFVIGLGQDFKSSLIIASIIKENFKGIVIAKSVNEQHEIIMRKLGVEDIVIPETAAAKRTFNKIINPLAMRGNDEGVMHDISENVSIAKIPPLSSWIGKEVKNLQLPKGTSISLLFRKGVKAEIVSGETIVKEDDIIAIIGNNKSLVKILEKIEKNIEHEEKIKHL